MVVALLIVIYMTFISLGLPDSMVGAAWPSMYDRLNVPVNYAGILTMITTGGTVISSLFSDRVIKKFSTQNVTVFSVLLTAVALLGISFSINFYAICCLCLVLGLGAGAIDAALNSYVALNFKAKHMSWLHCFWGLGAFSGPLIMSHFLSRGYFFNAGFRVVAIIQFVFVIVLVLTLPIWKKFEKQHTQSVDSDSKEVDKTQKVEQITLSKLEIVKIKGVKEALFTFICYCSIEATCGLWISTYLVIVGGLSVDVAAKFGFLFYFGITLGRLITGFLTNKFTNSQLIMVGSSMILTGAVLVMLPLNINLTLISFLLIGIGCAPIYPCMIHQTQTSFGAEYSQSIIGVEMASAYVGSSFVPPLFGFLTTYLGYNFLPYYICIFIIILILMQILQRKKLK